MKGDVYVAHMDVYSGYVCSTWALRALVKMWTWLLDVVVAM